jgi:hypothetical protein
LALESFATQDATAILLDGMPAWVLALSLLLARIGARHCPLPKGRGGISGLVTVTRSFAAVGLLT